MSSGRSELSVYVVYIYIYTVRRRVSECACVLRSLEYFTSCVRVSSCALLLCVCVCVREREREREIHGGECIERVAKRAHR